MKTTAYTLVLSLALSLWACKTPSPPEQAQATFTNPILAGFYPDPSICKGPDGYYLVTSSFSYFPGIPIFKSTDLVNWQQIGHVMERPSQLNTQGQRVSRGLFAPAISYHQGTFYVVCTQVDRGGNFIVTATDPAGDWSEPTYLPEVDGIDPSLFFEGDSAFIVYNSIPPNNESLYDGHRTIRLYALDKDSLQVQGDEPILLVNGGVDISQNPVWIEAPHLYHIGDWYYLMCAEGGTAYNHSEVIFRGKSPRGPFTPWDRNPILTQRHLDPCRPYAVTTAGHADLIQTEDGDWWAVFLACRPYGDNHYNIGRETFLAPVAWEDDWPIINPDHETVQYTYPSPGGATVDSTDLPLTGNFSLTRKFSYQELPPEFVFLRTVTEPWYQVGAEGLTLDVRPATASGLDNPSFIGRRQQHHSGSVSTTMKFSPTASNEQAGLIAFQSESHYYLLCQSLKEGSPVVQAFQATEDSLRLLAEQAIPSSDAALQLNISFNESAYTFAFAREGEDWEMLPATAPSTYLSTKEAGGFVGTLLAMYATSNDLESSNTATFRHITYQGNDEVFNQPTP